MKTKKAELLKNLKGWYHLDTAIKNKVVIEENVLQKPYDSDGNDWSDKRWSILTLNINNKAIKCLVKIHEDYCFPKCMRIPECFQIVKILNYKGKNIVPLQYFHLDDRSKLIKATRLSNNELQLIEKITQKLNKKSIMILMDLD